MHPRTAKRLNVAELSALLDKLVATMTLSEGEQPSMEKVRIIRETAASISTIAVGEGYEH